MASSVPQIYPPPHIQPQQPQMPYQPPPPYSNPYSPSTLYANSLISAYGQPPPMPPQPYAYEPPSVGAKRPSDDVFQSVDLLSKRPRPDSGGTLGLYPQRQGERLCAFYMTTRTCSFGHTCKFDHPLWVPFGGIPNWKEVTGSANGSADSSILPQRAGEQNCAFYMKTGDCKYGPRCKFNHPKDRITEVSDATLQSKDETDQALASEATAGSDGVTTGTPLITGPLATVGIAGTLSAPLQAPGTGEPGKIAPLNTKGFPMRQNETDCTFYLKTGSCKFGASCRFNHPEVVRPGPRPVLPSVLPPSVPVPAISYSTPELGMIASHPQRPGSLDCTYYLKTGECSFGATCKFHHPPNRQPSTVKPVPKLTLAGLPRREAELVCAYYMKTGSCKYGSTCRFDHPPPGEVAAKAAAEASRTDIPSVLDAFDVHMPQGVPSQGTLPWPWLSDLQQHA